MDFTLHNDILDIGVGETGAELTSVFDRRSGKEWLRQGASRYWDDRAPLLFPYTGRLKKGVVRMEGRDYPAPAGGFARLMDFTCIERGADTLVFRLMDSDRTREYYPYPFELLIRYELFGNELRQLVSLHNPGLAFSIHDHPLPFSLGFQPGFATDPDSSSFDYKILFDQKESPRESLLSPEGYPDGSSRLLFEHSKVMPLRDSMFAGGPLYLSGLVSDSVTLYNNKSGRAVRVGIAGYPHLMLWGPPKAPLSFICIGPWLGLPDTLDEPYEEFAQKPGLIQLSQGGSYEAELVMTFF